MPCDNNMSFLHPEWGYDSTAIDPVISPVMKRKFRWFFSIENITSKSTRALPCIRAARPKLQFKEMIAEHLNETIYYPAKPDWAPIQITLYDRCIDQENPIFTWLRNIYDVKPSFINEQIYAKGCREDPDVFSYSCSSCNTGNDCAPWSPAIDPLSFKPCACLDLYDGCGKVIESWVLEQVWPQNVDFGELDMSNSEVVTVDVTLKYDRAFQSFPTNDHVLYSTTNCITCTATECTSPSASTEEGGGGEEEGETPPLEMAPKIPDFIMV